ncbi:MAG: exonuclease domain-containing protein [Proteiniphilum sp.]|nr:exonuclease domain-containing protein [Proteiniphilum sp.]MDD3908434.1 exonuclease domain-containing protein [Proteiniphilum sp.]MDD4415642.1 exonuclease domain-containing protein [Proteiniphilum sp.]
MKYDFVAVDFENADSDQFACSVGIVAVKNNVAVEEVYHLIQPPGNRYGETQKIIHKIYPSHTENSPTFEEIWPEIEKYFSDQHLVMHNAPTDRSILHKTLSYYFIEIPDYTYSDTCFDLDCGKISLPILAKSYNIKFVNHHNALEDARATAQIWLKHINGITPDQQIIDKERDKPKKGLYADKKLDPDLYKKDLSKADKSSPFYDRKVVITGDFSDRIKMARKLKLMGADINSNITRKTHFVIIGDNPGPRKMETLNKLRFDGYSITTLSEDDLNRIFEGNLCKNNPVGQQSSS